jgi:Tfp pilus assembly protein PilN
MFRINLLPKEVLERRKYEDWFPRVFIGAVVFIAVFFGIYGFFWFQANLKRGDLTSIQEQSKRYAEEAQQLSIFENKEQELQKRQDVAQTALAGRINMGQTANDISLVLPDEVWLDTLTIDQLVGMTLQANTPRTPGESTDVAFKSVAKTLVRLNEIPELVDVWLSTATNAMWDQWASTPGQLAPAPAAKVVTFQATAKVVAPGASGSNDAAASSTSSSATHTVGAANAAQGAVDSVNSAATGTGQ